MRILTLIFFLFGFTKLSASIDEALQKISFFEKKAICFAFREFFLNENFGHVIFFDTKPVALATFLLKKRKPEFSHPLLSVIECVHDKYVSYGWKAWKKYEHLVPHPNFIFTEDETVMSNGDRISNICIINKKTFVKCIQENERIFQEILGKTFSYEAFLKQVEEKRSLLPLIHHNEALLGIVLGFGSESAKAFKAFQNEMTHEKPYECIKISRNENCAIWPIAFMGNPHSPHVRELVLAYEKEFGILDAEYKKTKDFLAWIFAGLSDTK